MGEYGRRDEKMDKMTKTELIDALYYKTLHNRDQLKSIVETIFAEMNRGLQEDGYVLLTGFGKFEVVTRGEHKGRNPKTQEDMLVPPKKSVAFRPSRKFKMVLNSD